MLEKHSSEHNTSSPQKQQPVITPSPQHTHTDMSTSLLRKHNCEHTSCEQTHNNSYHSCTDNAVNTTNAAFPPRHCVPPRPTWRSATDRSELVFLLPHLAHTRLHLLAAAVALCVLQLSLHLLVPVHSQLVLLLQGCVILGALLLQAGILRHQRRVLGLCNRHTTPWAVLHVYSSASYYCYLLLHSYSFQFLLFVSPSCTLAFRTAQLPILVPGGAVWRIHIKDPNYYYLHFHAPDMNQSTVSCVFCLCHSKMLNLLITCCIY